MVSPTRTRRFRPERWPSSLGLLAVLAIALWLAWNAWDGPATIHHLTITGGRLPGTKQEIAEILARKSGPGVRLTLREYPGSVESLDRVDDGQVDLALVQGGLDSKRWSNVRQVAALQIEPLQLVVRRDLFLEGAEDLRALKGKTVNLGEPGSGTEILAREVLNFVGLRAGLADKPGDYTARSLSHQQLLEIKDRDELPDAVFAVASPPTPIVRHLVSDGGYRLVPLPFVEAFALENLVPEDRAAEVGREKGRVRVDKVHLHETRIPAFTYGVEPAVPAMALPTLGTRILVVTNRKTSDQAVKKLLESIYLTDFAEVARPPLDASLLELPPEFPLHPGTVEFMQRNKPLIIGENIDFLEKTTSLAGAIAAASFVIWQWLRRRYRRRRELGFESYLLKVTAIEHQALQYELAAQLDLAALIDLQGELGRLKSEAMERFTNGELEGEGLISGFLTHANDARDYLARLILHARTTIEKQARRQGLSPDAAWDLAIGAHDGPMTEADQGAGLAEQGDVL